VDGSSIASADAGTQAPLYDQFWNHHLVKNPMVVEHEPAAVAARHRPRDEYVTDYVSLVRKQSRSYIRNREWL